MLEAGTTILSHIETLLSETLNETIEFIPKDEGDVDKDGFGLYNLIQNTDYDLPWVHIDVMNLRIFHTSKASSQRIVSKMLSDLNVQNMHSNQALFAAGYANGVKYQDVMMVVRDDYHNEYIDNKTYFALDADIIFTYVEVGGNDWRRKPAFIEGE